MNKKTAYLLLYCILIFAFTLRLFGLNWDNGTHLHPDERAIVLSVIGLHLPRSFSEFLTPESPWNTHFFAYGNFPFYLLRIVGTLAGTIEPRLADYDGIELVGRFLSALFDVGTVCLLFFLGKKIRNVRVGLIASSFYSLSVLPIQLSHFYAVDTPLTFLITLLLILLLSFYEKQSVKKAIAIGAVFAFSLATKVSALVLVTAIGFALSIDFFLVFLKRPHKIETWTHHFPRFLRRLMSEGIIILVTTIVLYIVLSPYTFLDFSKFQQQTLEQSRMMRDAFTFPYTLQYVGKIPYFYEFKNIALYGLGPLLAVLCFSGLIVFLWQTVRKRTHTDFAKHVILIVFFLSYVGVVGSFAVGFMRYMLPVYPMLCLFGAILTELLFVTLYKKNAFVSIALFFLLSTGLLVWPLSFMHIYTTKHTRISASEWIHANIPPGDTIAVEHWDDALPLSGIEQYNVLTYPLYEPDSPEKWTQMQGFLDETDYIILSSNRLYVPLQKLTDCGKLPHLRCYTKTAFYYQSLFNGSLGFKKVAEFTSYPRLEIGPPTGGLKLEIHDDAADESFTVYDHPKVLIFKKQPSV
ncbi:MAG: glycosyltransferase family 39 protein [bacterium]|nr:glycosyltransferase family 39 protein [bacterium]